MCVCVRFVCRWERQTRQELALAKEDAAAKSTIAADAIRRHGAWRAMFEQVSLTADSLCRVIAEYTPAFQRSPVADQFREIAVKARAVMDTLVVGESLASAPLKGLKVPMGGRAASLFALSRVCPHGRRNVAARGSRVPPGPFPCAAFMT